MEENLAELKEVVDRDFKAWCTLNDRSVQSLVQKVSAEHNSRGLLYSTLHVSQVAEVLINHAKVSSEKYEEITFLRLDRYKDLSKISAGSLKDIFASKIYQLFDGAITQVGELYIRLGLENTSHLMMLTADIEAVRDAVSETICAKSEVKLLTLQEALSKKRLDWWSWIIKNLRSIVAIISAVAIAIVWLWFGK